MKKPQFDQELVRKMNTLLQGHEEPYSEGEWEKFSSNYFHKKNYSKKRNLMMWLSGLAASVCVILFFSWSILKESASLTNSNVSTHENSILDPSLEFEREKSMNKEIQPIENEKALSEHFTINQPPANAPRNSSVLSSREDVPNASFDLIVKNEKMDLKEDQEFISTSNLPSINDVINSSNSNPIIEPLNADKMVQNWLSEGEFSNAPASNSYKDPVKIGLVLSPQTISQGTEAFNFGAGIMSQISFSRKIKLDVGLALARQEMNVNQSPGPILASGMDNTSFVGMPVFPGIINQSNLLRFTHLEIPLNVKYKLSDQQKSDWYLISGISSMLYFNQSNLATVSTLRVGSTASPGNTLNSDVQVFSQTITPESVFSKSYATGALLNLSFGYEYQLKKGSSISIEPFYKFSLGEQTFTNQTFGIGGMNMRMNLHLKKK
jgi:hypothetical protein